MFFLALVFDPLLFTWGRTIRKVMGGGGAKEIRAPRKFEKKIVQRLFNRENYKFKVFFKNCQKTNGPSLRFKFSLTCKLST